jgi:Fe-S-cluster-containing dehydrogenase component
LAELCGIVADLDLCVGCYACEVACKQENNVPIGTRWIRVIGVGPEELDGKLRIDFIPVMTEECTLCEHRFSQNLEPTCVDNCPTQALRFCRNSYEVLEALHSGRRFQICKVKSEVICHV